MQGGEKDHQTKLRAVRRRAAPSRALIARPIATNMRHSLCFARCFARHGAARRAATRSSAARRPARAVSRSAPSQVRAWMTEKKVEKGQAEQLLKYLNLRHAQDSAVNEGELMKELPPLFAGEVKRAGLNTPSL